MNAGDRCVTRGLGQQSFEVCHSRESGNPYGTSLRGELASLKDSYPAHAQWIPAIAGMTGWGAGPGWPTAIGPPRATSGIGRLTLSTGMPVEAVSMRLPRHALPRGKLAAVPGNAKKCRVDQATRIRQTPCHPEPFAVTVKVTMRSMVNYVEYLLSGNWQDNLRWIRREARSALIHPTHYLMTNIYPATGVPRNRPLTRRSSSALSQWMPSRSPNSSQSALCSGDARRSRDER